MSISKPFLGKPRDDQNKHNEKEKAPADLFP